MAKLVALYTVVVNVLANAGLMVSDETAKQIRQVCTWANVKFTFPKLEDAVMDFYMLSLKYYRLLHERGTHTTDDWLARNMVKAFRQNRDENKICGVIYLLEEYIQKETTAFLNGSQKSIDFTLEPKNKFIDAINSWIRDGFITANGEALRSRLVKLFNLDANVIIMHVSKDGTAESFRLVSTFGQKDEQIDVEAEEHLADECQVSGTAVEEETHVVIPTGFVPFSNQAAAVMNKSIAASVGIIAHPALQNLANDSVKETAANVGVSLNKFNVKPEDIKRWQLLAIGNRIAAKEKAKHTKWEERKDIYPPSPEEVLKMLYDPAVENDILRAMIVSRKEVEKAAAKEKKQVTEATVSSYTKSNVAPSKKDDIVIKVGDKDITMRINASRVYASYIRGDIRMKDDSKPAVKFSWGINSKTGKPYDEIKAEKYDKVLKKVVQMRSYSIVDGQKVQGEEEKKNASILNCIIAKLKAMGLEPIANASINTWGQKGGKAMGLYSLYFYSMFMLFYSKWTWEEIEMMEATRLHPVVRRVFAPSKSKRDRKVLDAVMEVSEQYLKDHPENHENALPYSMAVSEYSGTVMSVRVYSGHYEKLVNILRQYPCTEIVGIEVDPTNEAYYIVKLGGKATVKDGIYTDETGDFGAIINDIYKAKLITSTKIKMSSRPEIRMVSKSRAYNRDYFYYQQVIMYAGIRKKDGKPFESVKYNVDRMDEGSTVRMLNVHQGKTLLQTKSGGSRYFEKGSDFFMTIQINARDKAMMPHADQMLKRVYVMRNKTFDNGIAVGYEVMTGEGLKVRFFGQRSRWIKNPVTGKREEHIRPDASMENIQKGIDKGSVQVYEPFFESPSMTRTQTILYVNVTKRSREELIAMVNRGSCGAFEIMQTAYYKQQLPAEKAMKKISRLSLMMTGSAKFGIMKNFAWFQGDLKAFGSVFHDGQGFISAEFVQAVLKAMGFDLSLRECAKFCNQGRFGAVKGFNLVDLRKVMRKIMDSLIERGIAKGYVKVDPTMVQATDIEKNPKIEALGCGKYDGYILYCGNLDEIDYFGDSTNVKCMFDLSQELEYCLMDIPVAPKGHAVTSRQICNVMQFMKNFVPVFTKLGQNTIDHILTKKMGDTDVLDDSWEYDETSKDISNSTFASDVLSAIIPNIDQMDASIRRVQYKGMIDAMNKTCNRFNFRVKGGNFKIVGDLAGWFGARLLNFDEMYSPTIKSSNGLVYAVAFRHPLCGRGEHLPVKFVDKKELFSRIDILKREDGSNVPEDEKEALRLMIEFIMPGICMIGSTYEFVAAYFSGADFDGDSITLIWEEALVEAALDLPLYYVLYGGHNASAEKFQFGYDLIPGSFRYQYGIGGGTVNPSIGTLAGYNVTVLGMLNRVIKDETGKVAIYVRNMFRPEVKDFIWKVVKGDYKRKYKGNVNFEGFEATYAEDFIKAVATCGNTREEVIDMLKDLNVIISKCMNDVIDAAKTGDKVIVPFLETIQSRIRSGAVAVDDYGKISMVNGSSSELKPLIYSIRGTEGEIEKGSEYYKYFNCPLKMDETDPEHPVLVFEDELTELRNNVLEYAHEKLTAALQVGVTDVFGTYQSQDEYLHNTLTFLSTQFADIMDRNVGDRKTMKLALAAMTRNIMRKHSRLSMDSLIYEVRAASWYTNKKTGKAESNSYYLSFVPELAKFYVDRFCPDKVFTNRVYKFKGGHAEFGQEITFVDGFSKETGFYAESPINGTFRLELSREGNPVVRQSVRDMIPSVEEDENCVLIELKNDHLSGEVLLDEIEKERANGSIFKIEYAIGDKVVYSYKDNKGAYLHLTANGKPLAGIRVPSGKAYYQYHLWNKQIDIDLTEMGTRGGDDGKMDIVYLVGHLCTAAKKVNSDPTALTNLAA